MREEMNKNKSIIEHYAMEWFILQFVKNVGLKSK